MATKQSCDTIWRGSRAEAMTPEQSSYSTHYIRTQIIQLPEYQSQIKAIAKTAKVSEDVALRTIPWIHWDPEEREASIVVAFGEGENGKYYSIKSKGDLKKKVKALFSQPREALQSSHQDFQLQLQDLALAVALMPVASDGLRPVVLEIAEEDNTDAITQNELLQAQREALQGFQEALGDVARNSQTLEQRCLQSLQSSDRSLQLQQSNNKSIRDIAMGSVGVLVAILAIKLFSTF